MFERQKMELLLKQGLIQAKVKILESNNPFNKGIEGIIIDETKDMITISNEESKKKLIKSQNIFEIKIQDQKIKINGKLLTGRPEERIKKWLRTKNKIIKALE